MIDIESDTRYHGIGRYNEQTVRLTHVSSRPYMKYSPQGAARREVLANTVLGVMADAVNQNATHAVTRLVHDVGGRGASSTKGATEEAGGR